VTPFSDNRIDRAHFRERGEARRADWLSDARVQISHPCRTASAQAEGADNRFQLSMSVFAGQIEIAQAGAIGWRG
jgi:hypothetical protein